MKSQSDILIDELRSLDPVRLHGLDQAHCDSVAENLLNRILVTDHESGSVSPLEHRPGHSPRKKRVIAAAVAAAAAAALALVIGLPGGVGGNQDAVAAALDEAAETAAVSQPAATTGLPYLYLKTRFVSVNTSVAKGTAWSVYKSETKQEWAAHDGSGRRLVVEEPPKFVGPADRANWEAAGEPSFLPSDGGAQTTESTLSPGTFDDGFQGMELSALPTDPSVLSEALRQHAEGMHNDVPTSAQTLELIGEILRNPAASPELRAALYEAAAMVPGIEYLGEKVDVMGRTGVAVGLVSPYSGQRTLYSLIYDPSNSEALAMEATALEPVAFADTEAPFVISATIYLASGGSSSLSSAP